MVFDAEGRNPRHSSNGLHLSGGVVQERRERDGEAGDGRQQREDARGGCAAAGQQQQDGCSDK